MHRIKTLSQLKWMMLSGTQVSDAGLAHLSKLTHLEELHLDGTQITDAGLISLKGLTSLRELDLSDSRVSDVGVAKLQKTLPRCEIWNRSGRSTIVVVSLLKVLIERGISVTVVIW